MILCTRAVEEYIGLIFTNYDIAYVGKRFSQSFLNWIDAFTNDTLNAYNRREENYIGSVASIFSAFYYTPTGEVIMYIYTIAFNPMQLAIVRGQTLSERAKLGLPTRAPMLVASKRSPSDYMFYNDGGMYNGHLVNIVKNKKSSKTKPRFNYYDTITHNMMFDYEFYSAFPFENNKAIAWATDGHKYILPLMQLIENKNNKYYKNNNIMRSTKNRIRLIESQLHNVIKECVQQVLREAIDPVYDELARPNGELELENPYTWAESPGGLKKMGYDDNGIRRGKKYYDHLLNPNWQFNRNSGHEGFRFATNNPQKEIVRDIERQRQKDEQNFQRALDAADKRPLHRQGSLNRAMDESIRRAIRKTLR